MDGMLNSAKKGLSGMMGTSTSTSTSTPPKQQGGSKHSNGRRKRGHRSRYNKRGGSSVVATAALPFGLLALQKFFQTRKGYKDLNQMKKSSYTRRRKKSRR